MNSTISKKTIQLYKIRGEHGYWADISIDESALSSGRIQIASDFGSWQNYWGACGSSFKEFLTQLNIEYTAEKFGADKHFDLDATIAHLNEYLKDMVCDDDVRKEIKSEIKELSRVSCKEEFIQVVSNSSGIMDMTCYQPDMVYTITPLFQKFWNTLWPVFINELKTELKLHEPNLSE